MLDKEKITLMTKMAAYEKGEGKEYLPISRYYRKDYVGKQMIKTYFYSTIAFVILFLLNLLYHAESWTDTLYQIDYQAYAVDVLIYYLIFVVIYQVIAWVLYNFRYKKLKQYHVNLKKLKKLYEKDEKMLPLDE